YPLRTEQGFAPKARPTSAENYEISATGHAGRMGRGKTTATYQVRDRTVGAATSTSKSVST
ncbi:hypothetical protein ACQ1Z2_16615, partial [Enterococcus faecalis]|uniref:hypothetical protein n=1 Tax=Enterococcus faecalis TaxID=1351 RepID=UPI003D6A5BD4